MKPSARNSTCLLLLAAVMLTAVLFFTLGPGSTDHEARTVTGKGHDENAEQTPAMISPAPGSQYSPPSIEELKSNPHALDPAPLPLAFGAPPFERQGNGTIHKKDVMEMLDALNEEGQETESDLGLLRRTIESYRLIFHQNPIAGENRDVVAALTGRNPHRLIFLDPAHPALSAGNELLDRWGTPFRFHPISGSHMEFSSAGPDGAFGTNDDITLEEPELARENS